MAGVVVAGLTALLAVVDFTSPAGPLGARSGADAPPIRWVELDGAPQFWLGQNPRGHAGGFERHFDASARAGERFARIHLRHGLRPPLGAAGTVDEPWVESWSAVFQRAAASKLYVMVVFDGWAEWADERSGSVWHRWSANPYNVANGGPAARPEQLFGEGETRARFLAWIGGLVERWSVHDNVVAWEIFSELDLVTGAEHSAIVDFVELAAAEIRRNDPRRRPVAASVSGAEANGWALRALGGVRPFDELWQSDAVDWVQVHPYPGPAGNFDLMKTLVEIAPRLHAYGKPVLVGESGLHAFTPPGRPNDDPTIEGNPRAHIGYRQAAWAALMSGYSVGGMFWWWSGYGAPEPVLRYGEITGPVARFAADLELRGLRPVAVSGPARLRGVALASDAVVAGYVRDEHCVAPEWPGATVPPLRIRVEAELPGATVVELVDPRSAEVVGTIPLSVKRGALEIALPAFREDLVFRIESARTARGAGGGTAPSSR